MDIELIKKQVRQVVRYSQLISDPIVDDLIDTWLENKRDFIEVFGGQLIWEMPGEYTFPLNQKQKDSKITDFIDKVYYTYRNPNLTNFIEENSNSFFSNRLERDTEYNGVKIPRGMKLTKAFKYFEKDKSVLDAIQTEASRIIQEDKITGKLCFSVHPLDYLSSSENTYNWRSCHALDGEYCAGNLSYMTDKCTVICYLKGEDNVILKGFGKEVPWNSKKWRVLIHCSDNWNLISPGRQYPFATDNIVDIIRIFLKVIKKNSNYYTNLTDYQINSDTLISPHIEIRGRLKPIVDVVIDPENPLHYNDLLHSHCYNMMYTVQDYPGAENAPEIKMHVGNDVKCLCCGKNKITSHDIMMCDDCDLQYGVKENDTYAICPCCGTRFFRDDGIIADDTDLVCPDCYEQFCFTCECCGDVCYREAMYYDEDYDDFVCQNCYEYRQERLDI